MSSVINAFSHEDALIEFTANGGIRVHECRDPAATVEALARLMNLQQPPSHAAGTPMWIVAWSHNGLSLQSWIDLVDAVCRDLRHYEWLGHGKPR